MHRLYSHMVFIMTRMVLRLLIRLSKFHTGPSWLNFLTLKTPSSSPWREEMVKVNLKKVDFERQMFFCERFSCQMFVKACIQRQTKKHVWGGVTLKSQHQKTNHTLSHPECQGCKQGKEILEQYEKFKQKGNVKSG